LVKVTTVSFVESHDLSVRSIKFVNGLAGLYFIHLTDLAIAYPFGRSQLIYIGLSESKQNSIGSRLRGHLSGQSGNLAIRNYAARYKVEFTYHTLDVLSVLGTSDLYELESYFLSNFQESLGAFPICNGQSGMTIKIPALDPKSINILWESFAPKQIKP
jgi:hypothetical protein